MVMHDAFIYCIDRVLSVGKHVFKLLESHFQGELEWNILVVGNIVVKTSIGHIFLIEMFYIL